MQLRPGPELPLGSKAAETHLTLSILPLLPWGLLWALRKDLSLFLLTSFKGKAVRRGFTEINTVHLFQVYNVMQ